MVKANIVVFFYYVIFKTVDLSVVLEMVEVPLIF